MAERLAEEALTPGPAERLRAALAVCGKYADRGARRVAHEHDRYLAEAFRA